MKFLYCIFYICVSASSLQLTSSEEEKDFLFTDPYHDILKLYSVKNQGLNLTIVNRIIGNLGSKFTCPKENGSELCSNLQVSSILNIDVCSRSIRTINKQKNYALSVFIFFFCALIIFFKSQFIQLVVLYFVKN